MHGMQCRMQESVFAPLDRMRSNEKIKHKTKKANRAAQMNTIREMI